MVLVGGYADDAMLAQHVHGALQQADRIEQLEGNQRLHDVELQLPGLGGHGQCQVITNHLEGHLVDRFGDHRVDLAWHDRAARLAWRQVDFVDAGARAAGEQTQVVADLRQLHRQALEHARERDEGAHVRGGFDEVGSGFQRMAADGGQALHRQGLIAGVGVDPGADGSAAEVHFDQQLRRDQAQVLKVLAEGGGKRAEFLAEGHGHCVLQLGAAHLEDVRKFPRLAGKGLYQAVEAGQQGVMTQQQAQADGGRVGVVGRLRHVHVVVRVQVAILALGVVHVFQRQIGDHFIGIHVGRGAGAALNHVDDELVVVLATDQVRAGLTDCGVLGAAEVAEFAVGVRRRLLDHGQCHHQFWKVRQRHA